MSVWVVDHSGMVFVLDQRARLTGEVPGLHDATSLTAGEGAVWILSYDREVVTRVEPESMTVREVIRLNGKPIHALAGAGGVWVTLQIMGPLMKIDPISHVVHPVHLNAVAKAAGRAHLWADEHRAFDLSVLLRFDPATGEAVESSEFVNLGGVVTDDQTLWLTHQSGSRWGLSILDPMHTRIIDTVFLPHDAQPHFMALVDGTLIVTGHRGDIHRAGLMCRLDARSGEVLGTKTMDSLFVLASGHGAVWAYDAFGNDVLRVDPTDLAITARTKVGERLRAMAVFDT
jgi:hypothetical protein